VSAASITDPVFDEPREHPGFTCRRARLGHQIGSQKLGLSLWELPPGEAAYPYHWHLAEEEVVVVLEGEPSLRTPDGWRDLERGEVVSFLVGEEGAHQIANNTDAPVRFLALSNQQPDIVVYGDTGKIGAFERRADGGGLRKIFPAGTDVDYWHGESR
jgi:uncharacterized cupin superfamily protein